MSAWTADAGYRRLALTLTGELRSEIGYEPADVELVLTILVNARRRGIGWDEAWFTALRNISPPRTCTPELRARIDEAREAIHEAKPYLHAAYEDNGVLVAELERAAAAAERRLSRLLPAAAALAS